MKITNILRKLLTPEANKTIMKTCWVEDCRNYDDKLCTLSGITIKKEKKSAGCMQYDPQ